MMNWPLPTVTRFSALCLTAGIVASSLSVLEAGGAVGTAGAQPAAPVFHSYPAPRSLQECRSDPARFARIEPLTSPRRRGRLGLNEDFYVIQYMQTYANFRVAANSRNFRISQTDAECAFLIAVRHLYQNFSSQCVDDFVRAYGAVYPFFTYFRTGFYQADESPRFFLLIPEAQSTWGIGMAMGPEAGDGRPFYGPRDRSCPIAVELNLVTGTPTLVTSVPAFVRR